MVAGRFTPLLLAALMLGAAAPALAAEPVKDAVAAEKIAAEALQAKIRGNYENYMRDLSWQATRRGDFWFAMPVIPANIGADLMEQNGWIVQIDARNGQVLGVYLQF